MAKRKDTASDTDKPLVISVRVTERETSEEFVRYISAIRNDRKKNLSPIALEMMYEGYKSMMGSQEDKILLPLPRRLTRKQKEWLKHDLSVAFLSDVIGRIIDKVTNADSIDITGMIDEVTNNSSSNIEKRNEVFRERIFEQITPRIDASDSVVADISSDPPKLLEKNDVTSLEGSYTSKRIKESFDNSENEQDENDDIFAFANSFNNVYAD